MMAECNRPKRRRMLFRFSVITMFVLVTVVCVWLGVVMEKAGKQRRLAEAITSDGGMVVYDYQWISTKRRAPKVLIEVLGVDFFHDVRGVIIGDPSIISVDVTSNPETRHLTVPEIERLKGFPHLSKLAVTKLADEEDVISISKMENIVSVVLYSYRGDEDTLRLVTQQHPGLLIELPFN